MTRLILTMGLAGVLLAVGVQVEAGNKEMIEQQVQELDELNKQAVGQIENLPSHGQIDLKAHVTLPGGVPSVEILEKKVTVKEAPIDFKAGNATLPPAQEAIPKEPPDEQHPK